MDAHSSNRNWKRLHETLFKRGILKENETNYDGGGSPIDALITALNMRYPELKLSDFIEKLEKIQRNDVAEGLKRIQKEKGDHVLVKELDIEEKECLKTLNRRDGKNWEHLARDYGFDFDQKQGFKNVNIRPDSWSPTERMLEDVLRTSPGFLLKDLVSVLREIHHNDLANKVIVFMQESNRESALQQSDFKEEIERKKTKSDFYVFSDIIPSFYFHMTAF